MKNWWESKVVWAMIVQSLISILLLAQEWYAKGDFSVPGIIGLVVGILVIVLRVWFTDQPVATSKARAKETERAAEAARVEQIRGQQFMAEQYRRK